MNVHQFNKGTKSWKIYANKLISISGDDLEFEAPIGKQIKFKEGLNTYTLADLSNSSLINTNYNQQSVTISGNLIVENIIPDISNTYDLGSVDKPFRDIYVSENSIYMGEDVILTLDENDKSFKVKKFRSDWDTRNLTSNTSNILTNRGNINRNQTKKEFLKKIRNNNIKISEIEEDIFEDDNLITSKLSIKDPSTNKMVIINPSSRMNQNFNIILPDNSGQYGEILQTDGNGNLSWTSVNSLPSQTGNDGKILLTNGNNAIWSNDVSLNNIDVDGNIDVSGNILANGRIDFFQNNNEIAYYDPSSILNRLDTLDNSVNTLLTSNNDACFNNVDVSGTLNVQGEKVMTVPALDICGNDLSANTTYEITTGPVGSINNISFVKKQPANSKVFMRMQTNDQTGNIHAQTISAWKTPDISYPNNMFVSYVDIFRPPRDGYYLLTFNTSLKSTTGNSTYATIRLKKNGGTLAEAQEAEANDQGFNPKHRFLSVSDIIYITSSDTIRIDIQADNQYRLIGGARSVFIAHNVD